jgi:hypothetical protein
MKKQTITKREALTLSRILEAMMREGIRPAGR